MKLYVELVLLDNFLMDSVLAFLSLRCCRLRVRFSKIFLAAGAGAVYSAGAVALPFLASLPMKLIASLALCAALLGRCTAKRRWFLEYLRLIGALYAVTFLVGGSVYAVSFCRGSDSLIRSLLAGLFFAILLFEFLQRKSYRPVHAAEYRIEALIAGNPVILRGRLDTGNLLKDGGGGGVIVADQSTVLAQLSVEIAQKIASCANDLPMRSFLFRSAGGPGELTAILPEELLVMQNARVYRARAYIALCPDLHIHGANALLSEEIELFSSENA